MAGVVVELVLVVLSTCVCGVDASTSGEVVDERLGLLAALAAADSSLRSSTEAELGMADGDRAFRPGLEKFSAGREAAGVGSVWTRCSVCAGTVDDPDESP